MTVDLTALTINRGKTLAEVAFEAMHKLIREGSWAPRMRLPAEAELARDFNMSRPVIRQALSRLRGMGLIQSRQGSGSFVCEPQSVQSADGQVRFPTITNLADLNAFLQYREGIEGESAATAARRHTETQFHEIEAAMEAMSNDGTASGDYFVHLAIARASNNPFYANALSSVREQMLFGLNLEWSLSGTQRSFRDAVATQHGSILEAIRRRDGEAARAQMRGHLRWAHAKLLTGEEGAELPQ
jgi:GntR family transcriptional repressor for pyruvate dehydrogenase complex